MKKFFKNLTFACFVLIIGILFTIVLSNKIPIELDEFTQYRAFGCNYYNSANINADFYKECHYFDLALLKKFFPKSPYLPLRSYYYVGSIGSIFYIPIWFFWKSVFNVRLIGFLMLGIQAFFIEKIFKFNKYFIFICLVSFLQYSSQHIFDLGQLSFQCTSIFIFYYLIKNFFNQYKLKKILFYGIVIGLLLFLGLWVRLSYSFFYPAIFIIILSFAAKFFYVDFIKFRNYRKVKKIFLGLCFLGISFLIPSLILLTAQDRFGHYYYEVITNNTPNNAIFNIKAIFLHFHKNLEKFLFDPTLTITPEIQLARIKSNIFSLLNWIPFILLIIVSFFKNFLFNKKNKRKYFTVIMLFLATLVTLYTISASPQSWSMHHIVLIYPLLILSVLNIFSLDKKNQLYSNILVIFFFSQITLFYQFYQLPPTREFNKQIPELFHTINEYYSKNAIIIHLDWDSQPIHNSIGNHKEHVAFWCHFNKPDCLRLSTYIKLGKELNKNLLFVTLKNSNSLPSLKKGLKKIYNKDLKMIKLPIDTLPDYQLAFVKIKQ